MEYELACETSGACNMLSQNQRASSVAKTRCIRECVSPSCYKQIYLFDQLEEGAIIAGTMNLYLRGIKKKPHLFDGKNSQNRKLLLLHQRCFSHSTMNDENETKINSSRPSYELYCDIYINTHNCTTHPILQL
ncbi:uncharacterized protein [Venturia canescens]|uniref:uncharacterized protein isoform X2 n=1 Tax=Venturia canescens TaxID=32260 RepID=UPI001C9C438E|nr:uncharacterized protein LOC122408886 isoform X2 [Venturia canescens]